jgi:acetylornithine/succinyldiaminopimelate/putrescine aminotransferase
MMGIDVNIVSAKGATLYGADGKTYIDLISGISVSNVGHCHPKVVNAIKKQSSQYMHLMVYGEFNQSPQVKYSELLCKQLPESLNSVYFTTSGSEAVEGALKLAKRTTGRTHIIAFKKAYHGSTHGALSVMGDEFFKSAFRPLLPGIEHLPFNDLEGLKHITTSTAAVIIEPIQGEAGVRKADPTFLKALRDKCTATGTLLIFDEIQSGFGRTGSLFSFQSFDVVPDILLVAKGMGGGLPIGAFVAKRETMLNFTYNPPLGHINTFGGNAVTVAAAHAALELIVSKALWKKAKTIESIVSKELKHPLIREIRIHGALGAIEFGDESLAKEVNKRCLENGIITDWFLFCPSALRVAPPLTIQRDELKRAITGLLHILNQIAQ